MNDLNKKTDVNLSELYRSFVGHKYDWYYNKTWRDEGHVDGDNKWFSNKQKFNFASLIFGALWFFYRKMYFYGLIAILFAYSLDYLVVHFLNREYLGYAATAAMFGLFGNSTYRKFATEKVNMISVLDVSEQHKLEMAKAAGGTSIFSVIVYISLLLGLIYVDQFVTPIFSQEKNDLEQSVNIEEKEEIAINEENIYESPNQQVDVLNQQKETASEQSEILNQHAKTQTQETDTQTEQTNIQGEHSSAEDLAHLEEKADELVNDLHEKMALRNQYFHLPKNGELRLLKINDSYAVFSYGLINNSIDKFEVNVDSGDDIKDFVIQKMSEVIIGVHNGKYIYNSIKLGAVELNAKPEDAGSLKDFLYYDIFGDKEKPRLST